MDKESGMSELEAFEAWAEEYALDYEPLTNESRREDCFIAFQLGRKLQREMDAEICRQLNLVSDAAWVEGTLDCAAAILNQGSKE